MSAAISLPGADLSALLTQAITNEVYSAPDAAGLEKAKTLFRLTLEATRPAEELKSLWGQAGFEFRPLTNGGETLWLVRDREEKPAGGGFYLFRTNKELQLFLQAPHARNDLGTGRIAVRTFEAGKARALAASTITRKVADMAHLDNTVFQAFTLAVVETCPRATIVQLHGFESRNHSGLNADLVASEGTRSVSEGLAKVVEAFNQSAAFNAVAFPRDTKALGATLNAQGRAIRNAGTCRFLHLELSGPLRRKLARDGVSCRQLARCLEQY